MNIIKKIVIAGVAFLGFGCNSPSTAQTPTAVDSEAVWHDELSFGFMDTDDDKDADKAFKFAKKGGSFKNYYARFNLGNLYFVEGSTPAPEDVMDSNGKSGYLGVIMSQTPRLVVLPDKALFAQFMTALRKKPESLSMERRTRALKFLANTGEMLTQRAMTNDNNIKHFKIEPQDPSWNDENGMLTIDYYSYRSEGNMAPYLVKCQLRVDSAQEYTLNCERLSD